MTKSSSKTNTLPATAATPATQTVRAAQTSSVVSESALSGTPAPSPLMRITERPEIVMERGQGSWLWDSNGKRYLDFIQGWAVNSLGHCPAEIVDTLITQSSRLITPSPALHNKPQLELASRLVELSGLHQVHFSNSGSEANEVAVKLARKWGQQHKPDARHIVTTVNGFHGRTLAMMSASGKAGWDQLFAPSMPGFSKVPFGDIEAMKAAVDEKTLAIMLEPIQGEAGVITPPAGYLAQLRDLADERNVLLILDEVQTGVGRTGALFAFEHEAITPDIVSLGKGLGGGVPISATLAAKHVCCFEPGDQGGTFNGNPLMTAVASAVVSRIASADFLHQVQQRAETLQQAMKKLQSEGLITSSRGRGLLWAMDLPGNHAVSTQAAALEEGLLVNAARPATIRLMPSLLVTDSEIALSMDILHRCLQQRG